MIHLISIKRATINNKEHSQPELPILSCCPFCVHKHLCYFLIPIQELGMRDHASYSDSETELNPNSGSVTNKYTNRQTDRQINTLRLLKSKTSCKAATLAAAFALNYVSKQKCFALNYRGPTGLRNNKK